MKRLMAIGAAAAVSAGASAQDAVQWRVELGGNGHWYALRADSRGISWTEARARARLEGGDLASLGHVGCEALVRSLLNNTVCGGSTSQAGPYVGGYQDRLAPDYLEPSGGWRWVDGSAFPGSASVSSDNDQGNQDYLHFISANGGCLGPWIIDDVALQTENRSYIIEWSADCNADGLVDYGQIRSGELSDTNANNIPDCCENGTPCGCAGDTNLDGTIDGIDLATVLTRWAQSAAKFPNADCNRDGVIDGSDLATVLGSWGACP